MANEKWQDQLNELSGRLKTMLADLSETIQITGLVAKDELDKRLDDARSELEAAKENVRILAEKNEGRVNSGLIKMQMNLDAVKEELEAKREAKEQKDKEEYIEDLKHYAEDCKAMAVLLVDEANAALLEAQKLTEEITGKSADAEAAADEPVAADGAADVAEEAPAEE